MRVDLNFILENEEYTPKVGAEYEIAPGVWGKLKAPTVELQDRVMELSQQEGVPDLKVARMVLDGLQPFEDDKATLGMPSVVVRDFFTLVIRIAERLKGLSEASEA